MYAVRNRKVGRHWSLMLSATAVVVIFLFSLNVHTQHIEVDTTVISFENSSSLLPQLTAQNVIEYPRSITQNNYLTRYSTPQTLSGDETVIVQRRGYITEETPEVSVEYCALKYSSRMYLSENKKRLPPILYSFPGAGNTWSRLLIEYATGKDSKDFAVSGYACKYFFSYLVFAVEMVYGIYINI